MGIRALSNLINLTLLEKFVDGFEYWVFSIEIIEFLRNGLIYLIEIHALSRLIFVLE